MILNRIFFLTFTSQFFKAQTVPCKNCQSTAEIKRKPNSYLFIDTEYFFQENKTRYSGGTMLSNIPEKIETNNETYVLSGIVRNIPGYFTAFCRNTASVWAEHDDMSQKLRTIKNPYVTKAYMIIIIFIKI